MKSPSANSTWKMWQDSYRKLTEGQTQLVKFQYSPERVDNAIRFLIEPDHANVFPAQSRMVAIIYATLIEQVYGDEFYETLNDIELRLGYDPFFVPYLEDMEAYDRILAQLKTIPNWLTTPGALRVIEQFHLECTPKGIESLQSNCMTNLEAL